jgi:hypothetical protein
VRFKKLAEKYIRAFKGGVGDVKLIKPSILAVN